MTSVHTSSTATLDAVTKSQSGLADNFLVSLANALTASGANNSAFSNLLAQVDTTNVGLPPKPATSTNNQDNNASTSSMTSNHSTAQNATAASTPGVASSTNIVSNQKTASTPQKQDLSTSPKSANQKKTSDTSNDSASTSSTNQNSTTGQQAQATVPTTTTSSATDDSDQPSTTVTADTTATTPTDAQTVAAMMNLAHQIDKKPLAAANVFGNTATSSAATTPSNAAGVSAGVSDAQGKADLKSSPAGQSPVDALATAAANAGDQTAAATADTSASGTQNNVPVASASDNKSLAIPTDQGTSGAAKDALALQNDFFNFLSTATDSQAASVGAAQGTTDQVTASAGQDGASLDLDNGSSNNDAAALARNTTNATSNTTTSSATTTTKSSNPYSFASQLTATRTPTTTPSAAVDQVILQLNRSAKNGNDEMTLQLHPADLGRVSIKLDISSDGKVTGMVTADNKATLDMLSKDSRSLERSLQDAGFQADPGSLQFNMSNQSGNTFTQANNGYTPASLSDAAVDTMTDIAATTAPTETYYITPNGVNLSV